MQRELPDDPGSDRPDKMYNLAITCDNMGATSFDTKLAIWGVQYWDPTDEDQYPDSRTELSTPADDCNEFSAAAWKLKGNVEVLELAEKIREALDEYPDPLMYNDSVVLDNCFVSKESLSLHLLTCACNCLAPVEDFDMAGDV